MGTTTNLKLEVGGTAGDGGNEGVFDRNMQKIDDAVGAVQGNNPIVDATYTGGVLTLTKADATTIALTIPAV